MAITVRPFIRTRGDGFRKAEQPEQPDGVAGADGTGAQTVIEGDVGIGDLLLKMEQGIARPEQLAQFGVMRWRDAQAVVLR